MNLTIPGATRLLFSPRAPSARSPYPSYALRRTSSGRALFVYSTSQENHFLLRNISASFQSSATLKANAAEQTLDPAYQALIASLEAKGYTFVLN